MLCCDAAVVPIVMNGKGQPLDVGRVTRVIPDGLRRAVAARDRGCAHPGCGRPASWCHCHHIEPWECGGKTSLSNLVMLCAAHHRQIHSTNWIVRIRDGLPEFIPPMWIDPEQRPRRRPSRISQRDGSTTLTSGEPYYSRAVAPLGRVRPIFEKAMPWSLVCGWMTTWFLDGCCARTGALVVPRFLGSSSRTSTGAPHHDARVHLVRRLLHRAAQRLLGALPSPPEATAAEIDFLVRAVGLRPGHRVLDVCCGSGRHALPLARHGCRVTGVDVSAEAIAHARRAAEEEALAADLRIGDVRALPADVQADVAICMGNAFGYLDHAGTQAFLADLARIVVPGGALVLDYGFVAESVLPGIALEEEPMTIGGIEATSVNSYDPWRAVADQFTFRRGDEVHRGTSVQHVYTSAEVTRLVVAAGFADVEQYGAADRSPYRLGSPRLLLVARRP